MDFAILVTLLLLILINGLYVAAEFATVSVRKSRIQQLADDGNPLAKQLLPIITDGALLDRFVAACQIGITFSSLVLGAYGQATLSELFVPIFEKWGGLQETAAHSASALIILTVLTGTQMILGELIPKSLALQASASVALATVLPMKWSMKLFSGFIWILNGSGQLLLKLAGVKETHHTHIHSAEEISLLIAESRDGGLLEPDEHRRLSQALRLGIQKVQEIMVPRSRIQALEVNSDLATVVRAFTEKPFTRLPVFEGNPDNILGLVHARDVALRTLSGGLKFDLRSLIRPLLITSPQTTTEDLLVQMREQRKQMAVVKESTGQTVGLVGISDILDEFLGDVSETTKATHQQPQAMPDGRIRLHGSLRLHEITQWTAGLWDGEQTLSAKIIDSLGFTPSPGHRLIVEGIEIEIERATRRNIEVILLTPKNRLPMVEK